MGQGRAGTPPEVVRYNRRHRCASVRGLEPPRRRYGTKRTDARLSMRVRTGLFEGSLMTCSEFLQGFSDYYDAADSSPARLRAEEHLADCSRCRRYVEIIDRGRGLLQSFPQVEVSDDFRPRLRHRLFHVEDHAALRRTSVGSASGATATTALGMAVVLVFAAWAPLLSTKPEVELTPIVVSRPEPRALGLRTPPVSLFPLGSSTPLESRDVWQRSRTLLLRHSPLLDRTRSLLRPTDLE